MFKQLNSSAIAQFRDLINFVFVTATPIETKALHNALVPLPKEDKILVIRRGMHTYYIGLLGRYAICHVESRMGSMGIGASLATVQRAIDEWEPKAIVMVGIAFGIDRDKQNVGDILLAEQIIQYESKKVGAKYNVSRGPHQVSSPILYDRFKNNLDWSYELSQGVQAKLFTGAVLSGEVLIDNIKYRDSLLQEFPNAIGGEMEGAGVLASAYASNIHWILLKGVCDYADGLKGVDKDINQVKAAESAVSLCVSVFEKEDNFDGIISSNYGKGDAVSTANGQDVIVKQGIVDRDVLFDVYNPNVERHYLSRTFDNLFSLLVKTKKSIWVYGGSGYGKTCLVFRNIYTNERVFKTVDLGGCTSLGVVAVLNYINFQLTQIAGSDMYAEKDTLPTALDCVLETLNTCFTKGECILFEEIPVSESGMEIIQALIALFIKYDKYVVGERVCFMCTSIENPRELVGLGDSKIMEKVKFIELTKWEHSKIEDLCTSIEDALCLSTSEEQRVEILTEAKGSPRFVKIFYTNLLALKSDSHFDFKTIMAYTKSDFPSHD